MWFTAAYFWVSALWIVATVVNQPPRLFFGGDVEKPFDCTLDFQQIRIWQAPNHTLEFVMLYGLHALHIHVARLVQKLRLPMDTSYSLSRVDVVIGAHTARARGASSSRRETTSMGLVLAVMPRSTKYTCPGSVVIYGIKRGLTNGYWQQDI